MGQDINESPRSKACQIDGMISADKRVVAKFRSVSKHAPNCNDVKMAHVSRKTARCPSSHVES